MSEGGNVRLPPAYALAYACKCYMNLYAYACKCVLFSVCLYFAVIVHDCYYCVNINIFSVMPLMNDVLQQLLRYCHTIKCIADYIQ